MKTIGSQYRESLKEAGYKLISLKGKEAILEDKTTLQSELWILNNDYAGYVIEINGNGYEFVKTINTLVNPK